MRDLRVDEENPGEVLTEEPPVAAPPDVPEDIPPLSAEKETNFEPAQAEETEPSKEDTGGVDNQTNIKNIEAGGDAQFAETIVNLFKSETGTEVRNFKKSTDCILVALDDEEQKPDSYEFDDTFMRGTLESWLRRRILVLTGPQNIGKTTTALHLSLRLDKIPSVKKQSTYTVHPLKPGVKLNLLDLVKDAHNFANTTLIFVDAFGGGNLALREFFANLDSHRLKDLTAAMEENEMYLIFTTYDEMILWCEETLKKIEILISHPLLEKERLKSWFKKRASIYLESKNREAREIVDRLDSEPEEFDKLFETQQIPGILDFIYLHLERILNREIDVKDAIEQLEHLDKWFLEELTRIPETDPEPESLKEATYLSFELWCFVLTLTLTQCIRETTEKSSLYEGVPWMLFERFRKRITEALMEKIGISYPEKITLANYVSEQNWLIKGRAEIYRDADSGIDTIRFKNRRHPEQMWDVLLKNSRRVLSMLIPALEELAETPAPGIRSMAARILGRIGELDLDEITLRLAGKWIRGKPQQMATVSYLYEGILFSSNTGYRETCQSVLDSMHSRFVSNAEIGQGKIQRGLWTAIAIYKQIGKYNLSLAMSQLRNISEFNLTEQVWLEKHVAQLPSMLSRKIEQDIQQTHPNLSELTYHKIRTTAEKQLWATLKQTLNSEYRKNPYYNAFNYALVSLCLSVGPLKVFDELKKWFYTENTELKMFVALNFLRENGIADEIAAATPGLNLIVDDIASSENSVKKMTAFLESIFCGFEMFASSLIRSYYRRQFFNLLKSWARDSLQNNKHQDVIVGLFAVFLNNRIIPEIASGLENMLRGDAEFSNEENPLFLFRQKVFERSTSL